MNKTYRAVFSVGCGKDREDKEISERLAESLIIAARDEAVKRFDGVSITRNLGAWRDVPGHIVCEDSVDFTIVSDKREDFKSFASYLKALFVQSAVLLVVQEVEAEFV